MYKNVNFLDVDNYKDLRYTPMSDFSFARSLKLIPVTYSEVKNLCCRYPIVISETGGKEILTIVTAINDEYSSAIDEKGRFIGNYVPAFLRRYPFVLSQNKEEQQIGVDMDSGCFNTSKGEILYEQDGNPTKLLENLKDFLSSFDKEMQMTSSMLHVLKDKAIIEPSQMTVIHNDDEHKVEGFSVINREKLLQQDDSFLANLVRKGWSDLIELHHFSLNNFKNITKK